MKNKLSTLVKPYAYKTVLKYFIAFILFILYSKAFSTPTPVSVALSNALCYANFSPIILAILVCLSALITGGYKLMLAVLVSVAVTTTVFYFYRFRNSYPKYELAIYLSSSLVYYIFFYNDEIYFKIIISVITVLLTFISIACVKYLNLKGIKYQPTGEEFIMLFTEVIILTLGLINVTSPTIIWSFAIFTVLSVCRIFKGSVPFSVACALSLPFAIYYSDISFLAGLLVITVLCYHTMNISYYFSGLLAVGLDCAMYFVFSIHPQYEVLDFCLTLGVVLIFLVIPSSCYNSVKESLLQSRGKILARETINNARRQLKEKLYGLSTVFSEISLAFDELKKREISEEETKILMVEKTYKEVCLNCDKLNECKKFRTNCNKEIKADIDKTVKIGLAKGKITFIDVPKELTDKCFNVNALIFSINKDLAEYRNALIENSNFSLSRELIAKQSEGIAEMLLTLADSSAQELNYKNGLQDKLYNFLRKKGFSPLEILVYGDEKNVEISLVLPRSDYRYTLLEQIVSDALKIKVKITNYNEFANEKIHLILSPACPYKAVYGIASTVKTVSDKSGDTHSETMLLNNKFMIALSDGMGSGERANTISSITLSLLESLYKSGLTSQTILPLVNKILSINTDDSFSALDVCTIDLNSLQADFIKFGAPRGYLISEQGIKIVEGNSLPLGIIKELEPTVVSAKLNVGDTLIFMTDGISDAFGSTAEILDFIKEFPAKNPTSVAETLLDKAKELCQNVYKDDMTVLAVRIVKNVA